jgi:hypothetical protein
MMVWMGIGCAVCMSTVDSGNNGYVASRRSFRQRLQDQLWQCCEC